MNDVNTPALMNHKALPAILLLSFFLLAYILPLGVRNLAVPDETRYGEIPREMIASGDWIVPRLDGVRYFEKPVLGYWVQAGSLLLFGENNFAVRLPSALAVGLSALLVWFLVGRAIPGRDREGRFTAFLATLIFLSCFEVFGVGNTAVLDSLFSFFLTACIAAFYLATEAPPGRSKEKGLLMLAGLACGLAFLTKGFLAIAVPVMVVAPYLVWQRRYADLLRMAWLPIITAVVVALPWSILIHLREPDFWRFFFWNEHIRRFMADNAQHKEAFWFFFLLAPGMFLPWAFVVPAAVSGVRTRLIGQGPVTRLLRLCICWLVLPFLFFSLSRGKLLTYILPCFPPFAILLSFGLLRVLTQNPRYKLFQRGVAASAALFGLILVAFLYGQLMGIHGMHPYSQPWKAVMVVNGLIFFVLFGIWSIRNQSAHRKLILFGLSPALLFLVVHFTIPDIVNLKKSPGPFLEQHKSDIAADTIVISEGDVIRATCWYLRRSDVYVLGKAGELNEGMQYKDARGRMLDIKSAVELIDQNRGKTILIAKAKTLSLLRKVLPRPVLEDQSGPSGYALWKY